MRRAAAALLLAASLLPHRALAQGETAAPLRPRSVRVTLGGDWAHWTDVFGTPNPADPSLADGARVPLGAYFGGDPLGTGRLPFLSGVEGAVRTLTGLPGFSMSLGRSVLTLDASVRVTPIRLDVGLTRRVGLSVAVPIVRARQSAFLAGPDSTAATQGNVGLNPLFAAAGAYDTFRGQVDAALLALQAQATGGPASLRAQAQALFDQLRPTLCQMYALGAGDALAGSPCAGVPTAGFAAVLPVAATPAGDSLAVVLGRGQSSYASLAAQYAAQGVTLPAFTAPFGLPAAALDTSGLRRLFTDPAALGGDSLTEVVRTGIGDVEVGAWYQLADRPHWKSQLALTLRLPTGKTDDAANFIDVGTGDHQLDIEVALRNDLVLSRRLWLHLAGRYGIQRPDELDRRVSPWYQPLVPAGFTARVRRDLGDYLALDVAPSWRLDEGFSVAFGWHFFRQGASDFAYAGPDTSLALRVSPTVLAEGTAVTRMRVGAAATFSTLERYASGRARFPLRVTWGYQNTFAGRGGQVPHAGVMTLLVQYYVGGR